MTRYHVYLLWSDAYEVMTEKPLTFSKALSKLLRLQAQASTNGRKMTNLKIALAGNLFVPPTDAVSSFLLAEGVSHVWLGDRFIIGWGDGHAYLRVGDEKRPHLVSIGTRQWHSIPTMRKNNWKKELRTFLSSVREMDSKETD